MREPDLPEPRESRTDRRFFCKLGGSAALGILICRVAISAGSNAIEKEREMQGKITGITVKVQSIKGTCGAGCKVGDNARITENGVEGKICIHALYSMLPAAFAMLYDARFPWLQNPDVKTHACPDAANPVVFELTRNRA